LDFPLDLPFGTPETAFNPLSFKAECRPDGALIAGGNDMTPPRDPPGLTPRRRAIAGLLADGLDYLRIAERLQISRNTVSKHVEAMRRRYQANNNTHLIGILSRLGEVEPPRLPEGIRSAAPPPDGTENGAGDRTV